MLKSDIKSCPSMTDPLFSLDDRPLILARCTTG